MLRDPDPPLFFAGGAFFSFYGIDFPDNLLYNKYIR